MDATEEKTFVLGQKVRTTEVLNRINWNGQRVWAPIPVEIAGIVIGKRTLANGDVIYDDWGRTFVGSHYFTAYLIAYDLRRKFELAYPEKMEEI